MKKKAIGNKGEQIAADFISENGYKILARNWICNHKEVDIIAQKDNKIVFVEVKTRNFAFTENPSETVNFKKQKMLVEAANSYISRYNIDLEARFDVVIVVLKNSGQEVCVIENAFYPMLR